MKKKQFFIILILIFLSFLPLTVFAETEEIPETQLEVPELPENEIFIPTEENINKNEENENMTKIETSELTNSDENNPNNEQEIQTNEIIDENISEDIEKTETETNIVYSLSEEQFTVIEEKLNSIDSSSFIIMDFSMILSALILAILIYLFLHFMLERRKI